MLTQLFTHHDVMPVDLGLFICYLFQLSLQTVSRRRDEERGEERGEEEGQW